MYRVRFGVNIEKMMYRVRLLPNPNPKHGQSEHSIAWDKGQVRPLRPFRFVSLVSTTDLIHIDRANILQMSQKAQDREQKHGQSEHSIAWDKGQVRPLRPFRFVSLVSTTDLIHIDRANILQMSQKAQDREQKHGQSEHSIASDKGQVRPLRPFRFVRSLVSSCVIHIDRA